MSNLEPEKLDAVKSEAVKPEAKITLAGALKRLPARLFAFLRHNLGWKLIALLLALCLWAGLITQDPTLTRERVFNDVPLSEIGGDTLRRNGFIVVSGLDDETTVRLRVDVPQREYNTVTTSNYNPRVDLSKVSTIGTQTLKITSTSSTTYGTVTEVFPDSVEVTVDAYVTNYRIPVSVNVIGDYPPGFYGSTPSMDPSGVTVSGPESVVEQIARVVVDFDVSKLAATAGLVRSALPFAFEDINGNRIESDLIEVTGSGVLLRTIVVEQQLYATKSLSISSLAMTTGTPASGYEVKSVTAVPSVIMAAGSEEGLSALDALFLDQAVDVSGRSDSFTVELKVRRPSELIHLSSDSVMLYVEIAPSIASKDFAGIKLTFDTAENQSATCETKQVSVTISGPANDLTALKSSSLTAYCAVADLESGTYALPVLLKLSGVDERLFTYSITPQNVSVAVSAN